MAGPIHWCVHTPEVDLVRRFPSQSSACDLLKDSISNSIEIYWVVADLGLHVLIDHAVHQARQTLGLEGQHKSNLGRLAG